MAPQRYSIHPLLISVVLTAISIQFDTVVAETRLTPRVGLTQTFIDAKQPEVSDSGSVTVISPGFDLNMNSRTSTLDMSVAVDAEYYSGLDREDRELPEFDLGAVFNHDPGTWDTTINASIEQVNDDIDGLLSISDKVFNPNSQELRTADIATRYTGRSQAGVGYQSILGINRTQFEGEDAADGATLDLSMDNFASQNKFTWRGAFARDVTEDEVDTTRIDVLALTFYYRLSTRWQVFTDLTSWETDEEELDQESYLVGLSWSPNQRAAVRIGVGELDEEATYSLDARFTRKRLNFNASYSEGITSARTETLRAIGGNLPGTLDGQSVVVDPVLQRRADIGLNLEGRRSIFSLNLFDYTRDPIVNDEKEYGSGAEIGFLRNLSDTSGVGINLLGQRTELNETSDLIEIDIYYQKDLGENVESSIDLIFAQQDSSVEQNEYEQTQLGFSLLMRF